MVKLERSLGGPNSQTKTTRVTSKSDVSRWNGVDFWGLAKVCWLKIERQEK